MIQDFNLKKTIGKGNESNDLYILDVDNFNNMHVNTMGTAPTRSLSGFANEVSAQTWRHRIGHLSPKVFDLLKEQLNCASSTCIDRSSC